MIFSSKPLNNYAQRLRRLRYLAIGFLSFLLIPLGTLLFFGFQQMEKNLLVEYQREVSSLIQQIDRNFFKKRMLTNTIPVDAFDYYQQVYNPVTKLSERVLSRLSKYELAQPIVWKHTEGLVGYFQYDSEGNFSSPILPKSLRSNGLTQNDVAKAKRQMPIEELASREKAANSMHSILSQSESIQQLVKNGFSVDKELLNVAFDVPEYLIFYRVMLLANHTRLQGYIVKKKLYIAQIMMETMEQYRFDSAILVELRDVEHSDQADYFLYQNLLDDRVKITQPSEKNVADMHLQQKTIYQKNLLWPFLGYRVTVTVNQLPKTPAMLYSGVFIVVLIISILLACFGFYRLGVKQLKLGEQRLNFVSSVSHELKTPLTSIQMYSQMLKEGTVISESHQQKYFDFIFGESERLTRLINNILQLSNLGNQQQKVQPEFISLAILQDIIRSKTSSIMEKHNFQLNMVVKEVDANNVMMLVEQDAFAQIVINITDNAVKFFNREKINDASRQKVDFIFCQHPKHKDRVQLEIRDYGEGLALDQESKIFDLFYRGGNELTRTTQGTGIGLALVSELVLAQQGTIKAEKRKPGLSMLLTFKAEYKTTAHN